MRRLSRVAVQQIYAIIGVKETYCTNIFNTYPANDVTRFLKNVITHDAREVFFMAILLTPHMIPHMTPHIIRLGDIPDVEMG